MAENKHKFLLRTDLLKVVELLITKDRTNSTNTAGEFFYHILQYVNDRNPEAVNDTVELIFEPVKAELKSDLKKWEAYREKQAQNGAKGGATKWMNAKKKAGGLQANGGGDIAYVSLEDYDDNRQYEFNQLPEAFRESLRTKMGIERPVVWVNRNFPEKYFDLVECLTKVRDDVEWRTSVERNNGINKAKFLELLYRFVKEIKDSKKYLGYDGYDSSDGKDNFISHFANWVKIQVNK